MVVPSGYLSDEEARAGLPLARPFVIRVFLAAG